MTDLNPDLTLIRTALRMSRNLASSHTYGGLRYFYDKQVEAMAALDRLEEKFNGNGKSQQLSFVTPKTGEQSTVGFAPLTEADVQAATCSV